MSGNHKRMSLYCEMLAKLITACYLMEEFHRRLGMSMIELLGGLNNMKEQEKQPNKHIKRERELRGWSQQTLATHLDTTEQVVCRWENGDHKPNRHFQAQLCQLFGKNAEELGFIANEDLSSLPSLNDQQQSTPLLSDPGTQVIIEGKQGGSINLDRLRRLLLQDVLGLLTTGSLPPELTSFVMTQPTEETVSKANIAIAHCWEQYYTGNTFLVEQFLPALLSQLVPLFPLSQSQHKKDLAGIISQAYQLLCDLATDQENFGIALTYGKQALLYAEQAEEANIQVTASIRLANFYFHRKQSLYSLRAYKQALPLINHATPLLRGRVYAGLAEVLAMRNQQQEALTYMGLAHEHYPEHPEFDPAYYYTHFSRYGLFVFGEGQTRLSLNQPKEAQESFSYAEKNLLLLETEPLSHVDILYYQTASSVMLEVLEESYNQIQVAVTLAKKASSRLYYNKILAIYQEMQKKWPHERQVIELEELFQSW